MLDNDLSLRCLKTSRHLVIRTATLRGGLAFGAFLRVALLDLPSKLKIPRTMELSYE